MSNSSGSVQLKRTLTAFKLPINTPDILGKGAVGLGQCLVAVSVGLLWGCPRLNALQ